MSGAESTVLGAVNFGPAPLWQESPTLRELYDQACAGLIRMECENEELRAEVALLREEQSILQRKLESERDEACRESCRDKAAADGGWSNR
jgi:hypothetical protein